MQFGVYAPQTPFVPAAPGNDLRALTVSDDLSTMFPEQRDFSAGEMVMADDNIFSQPKTWVMIALIVAVIWAMKK